MDTLAGLWLPIVLSAVLAFVASSLIWNVLGAHRWHLRGFPDEAGAREALGRQGLAPGQYAIPYAAGPGAMKDPAFVEKLEKGPVAVLAVRRPGKPNMAQFLSAWFAYLLGVSALVAFVCGQTLPRGAEYLYIFHVAGAVAVAAYAFGQIPNGIWWGRPWKSVAKEFVDGLLYALLTAGCFAWLWPR
jgi:hypothetical protein